MTKSCGIFFSSWNLLSYSGICFFHPRHVVEIQQRLFRVKALLSEEPLFIFSYIHLVSFYADWIHQPELLVCTCELLVAWKLVMNFRNKRKFRRVEWNTQLSNSHAKLNTNNLIFSCGMVHSLNKLNIKITN